MSRADAADVEIVQDAEAVVVRTPSYRWEWDHADRLVVSDSRGLRIAAGPVQPAVVVAGRERANEWAAPGSLESVSVDGAEVTISWTGVNGSARLETVWTFDSEAFTLGAVHYASADPD